MPETDSADVPALTIFISEICTIGHRSNNKNYNGNKN
jgi:hypothetical protein